MIFVIVVAALGGCACLFVIGVFMCMYIKLDNSKSPWLQKHKPADGHTTMAVEGDEAGSVENGGVPVVKATELTTAYS